MSSATLSRRFCSTTLTALAATARRLTRLHLSRFMRTFLALDPDHATHSTLRNYLKYLRTATWSEHVRWVNETSIHLTLRFLGEISEAQAMCFSELLRNRLAGSTELSQLKGASFELSEPRLFPKPSRPRVIVCLVAPHPALNQLATMAEQAAVSIGLSPERHPFVGHITLGRTRESFPRLTGLPFDTASHVMHAGAIVLYRSDLTRHGAVYTPLVRF